MTLRLQPSKVQKSTQHQMERKTLEQYQFQII